MKRCSRSWAELALVLMAAACGHAQPATAQGGSPSQAADPTLPPAGFGSLRQDQIGVLLTMPNLRVRVIPLDERVIRLLAPDAYRSLHDMRESRAADLRSAAAGANRDSLSVFMVTFFGMQPATRFNPDDLLISGQNATYRPLGHIAMNPRFNDNQIDAREQVAAIYYYEPAITVLRPFTVQYGGVQSDSWTQALTLINAERTRVLARAASRQQP